MLIRLPSGSILNLDRVSLLYQEGPEVRARLSCADDNVLVMECEDEDDAEAYLDTIFKGIQEAGE